MILLLRTYKSSPYLSPYLSVYIFAIFPSLLLSPDLFIRQSRKQRKKTHTLTLWKHDPIPLRVCHFNHLLISFPSITPSSILLSCANTGIKTIHSPTRNNIPLMNIFHVLTLTLLLFSFFRLHLYLFFLHMFYLSPLILLSVFSFLSIFLPLHFYLRKSEMKDHAKPPFKAIFLLWISTYSFHFLSPFSSTISSFINPFENKPPFMNTFCFFTWFL